MQPERLSFVFTMLNQKEFRIATAAMFTCDLYAGVVPQMSPPPHDLEQLRTTMVDSSIYNFETPYFGCLSIPC